MHCNLFALMKTFLHVFPMVRIFGFLKHHQTLKPFLNSFGLIQCSKNIYALLGTAGITGSEIADVHKNGVTIFAAAPKLTFPTTVADATYSLLTAAARKVLKGDRLTLDIDSVHSGTAAIDLWVYIVIRRKTDNSVETNLAPSALT